MLLKLVSKLTGRVHSGVNSALMRKLVGSVDLIGLQFWYIVRLYIVLL